MTYAITASSDVSVDAGAAWDGTKFTAEGGSKVTITAKQYKDRIFEGFSVTRDDTGAQVKTSFVEGTSATYTFEMPNSSVKVDAIYTQLESSQVKVINGSGTGVYMEGATVQIKANKAPLGYRFTKWNVLTGNASLDNAASESASFTMPAGAVQVEAVYEQIEYRLSVTSGKGAGSYHMGDQPSLEANWPASGKEFASWTVNTGNAVVSAPDRFYSSLKMPAADVTVTATYKDGPSPAYNTITGIENGGLYLKNTTLTFTAIGNGMDNTNPNPGDYRYRPVSYQVSGVPGNWDKAPYTTSMSITAAGDYTLTVTYAKDVFDGSTWKADGTYDTKTFTFKVSNNIAPATGDSSPIVPLIVTAVIALLIIAGVIIAMRKRKK